MAQTSAPTPLHRRRSNAPSFIAVTHTTTRRSEETGDSIGLVPLRPQTVRFASDTARSIDSVALAPPLARLSPWVGAAQSPNYQVSPAAVDYFHGATAVRHSWRALHNLALVAGGRSLLSLGLAGILVGFVPGSLAPTAAPVRTAGPVVSAAPIDAMHIHHTPIFVLGIVGTAVGLLAHGAGLARFYNDTRSINQRRANVILAAGTTGALLVTAGGIFYLYGIVVRRNAIAWEALPLRSLGNFLVYGAIPNSFSASELVHGDIPLKNRIFWRDLFFALGGMMLMTWAQISVPSPPAPLWARELAQCFGIICIAMGGALPRVDGMRAQANLRALPQRV